MFTGSLICARPFLHVTRGASRAQVDILIRLADLQTRFAAPARRTVPITSGLDSAWYAGEPETSSSRHCFRPDCDPQPAQIVSAAIAQKTQYVELAGSLYMHNAMLMQRVAALERKKRFA
jgi:hypothetical protein